jgi:hypothetical protein
MWPIPHSPPFPHCQQAATPISSLLWQRHNPFMTPALNHAANIISRHQRELRRRLLTIAPSMTLLTDLESLLESFLGKYRGSSPCLDVYSYLSIVSHEEILTVLNLIILSRSCPLLLLTLMPCH